MAGKPGVISKLFRQAIGEELMEINEILKKYWGYDSFRPMQADIIQAVLSDKDTLAILPTGGGKSICFQVPALAKNGICLVVSPLIALMQDQVRQLVDRNIPAKAIYTGMSFREVDQTLQQAVSGKFKFLYLSPERLETRLFREYLPHLDVSLLAVDESHCISQWGYDFRPSYLKISLIREEFPAAPVLALTASATADVQKDILTQLGMKLPQVFRQSFERPNLSYSLFQPESKHSKVIEILSKVQGTAIVYCKTRRRTKDICEVLQLNGISADYYHAGINQEERKEKQENWISGRVRVIVSTNAFGMGIDKPDVRCVVHMDAPDCLENYYQEAGRAGRDGKKSFAVLLVSASEKEELLLQPDIRYPDMDSIRVVYQALVNYLQVPAGTSEENFYELEISDFIKKFSLNSRMVIYSLQALQQAGVVAFHDQLFNPPTVCFTTSKEHLRELEEADSVHTPLIKALLRNYGGILDFPSIISEKQLGRILRKDPDAVKNDLLQLSKMGVLEYKPRMESPRIRFLQNRVKTEDLYIDPVSYSERKEAYRKRLMAMISYLSTSECRSAFIGRYFGDPSIRDCGICDNCLSKKKSALNTGDYQLIERKIKEHLQKGELTIRDMLEKLSGFDKEKVWQVLDDLESECKIRTEKDGRLSLK